ncbi:MAG: site-specific integrase [Candidatus Gastranaerophilales bacterium]|nr:site-specific integrase [Candidatus Gastranaerophilales bacterium]
MAYYEKISAYTYRLVICQGYDSKGKKLRKRKTIKLDNGLTQRQAEKELNRQMILFEQEVLNGTYLDGEKITFAEFTKKWFSDYASINLAPATLISYKTKLNERILPAIGHIKLAKLQPTHIMTFYHNLKEDNIRLDGKYAPSEKLINFLTSYSASEIEKLTGVTFKTCKRLKLGKSTDYRTAQKICEFYKIDINKMFRCINSRKLSEKSIRNHIGIIGSILSTAVKWNIIKDNPIKRIDMKKVQKSKVKYYDDIQIATMLSALNEEPLMYTTMIYLTLDLGLRRGEVTGLCWSDIDFETSTVCINKQRHYVMKYGTIEGSPKTDAGTRTITASKTVITLLKQYRNQQVKQKLKLGTAWKNYPYVFLHDDGIPISPNLPYKWFMKFIEKHNLPKITFHQLRHTNASLLISAGEDIVTVSSRLGHADKNITLNTYSHIIKSKEAQVANKMDEFYNKLKINFV